MPYVDPEAKDRIVLPYVNNVGELTYAIDRLAEDLAWKLCEYDFANLKYEHLAVVRGALSNAADEFYRRVITPFEDMKIAQNGDVFVYPHREQWLDAVEDTSVISLVQPREQHEEAAPVPVDQSQRRQAHQ